MRHRYLLSVLGGVLMVAASSALAQHRQTTARPVSLRQPVLMGMGLATICVAPSGDLVPGDIICRVLDGDWRPQCQCPAGALPVNVPQCKDGERPLAESAAVSAARHAAVASGDMIHARFEGRPFCVRAVKPPQGRTPEQWRRARAYEPWTQGVPSAPVSTYTQ